MRQSILTVVLLLLFTGCVHPPTRPPALPATGAAPLLQDGSSRESMKRAAEYSLEALSRLDRTEQVALGKRTITVDDLVDSLAAFLVILKRSQNKEDLALQIREHFDFHAVAETVLFTGYYEPELAGSFEQTGRFRFPLYSRPDELGPRRDHGASQRAGALRKDPVFYSREEIDTRGVLAGRGLEMLYLDDPVERFFLHIQGAGTIRLPDNRQVHVQYDGSNGRPYTSIGKLLIEEGTLPSREGTLPGIKAYLYNHSSEQEKIMNRNARYVFFKIAGAGAQGVLDTPLTPLRSLATDPTVIPIGSLCYYVTRLPRVDRQNQPSGWRDHAGFAVSQDVGDAIQGVQRADIFFGTGPRAAAEAGHMMSEGKLYILLKKSGKEKR